MLQIKNQALVVSQSSKNWGTELIIKRDNPNSYQGTTRLSDVFEFTPPGFIYKDETGMGATTLELLAPRHSIIVEPIRITASSKAYDQSKKSGSEVLYVGSSTQYHPAKSTSEAEILDYLNDPKIKYKKIVVVADSFEKVFISLGSVPIGQDFFLLIDEIDSFQMDSKYRKSMEKCLELYTYFLPNERAMLSATRIEFSDPSLRAEPITYIRYDKPAKREIDVITTNSHDLMGIAADYIELMVAKHPNDKFFIAFNSVSGCFNLAEHLVKKQVVKKDDINIFCSSNSKGRVNEYYQELNTDKLPGKLNFFTSAYFSGFDLTESYHLITISGNRSKIHALSDRRIKQIAGRSRLGLFSETIIHDVAVVLEQQATTVDDLVNAAEVQIDSLNCLSKHFKKSELMNTFIQDISESFMNTLDDKSSRYVRKNYKGEFMISYLNIDAEIESIRIRKELYQNETALTKKLKETGHIINKIKMKSNTVVDDLKISQIDRDNETNKIIDLLLDCEYGYEIKDLLNELNYDLSVYQKEIANEFIKIVEYVDPKDTLEKMRACLLKSRDKRKFNNFMAAAIFQTYSEGHLYVDRLDHYLPVGKRFTSDELKYRFSLYFEELHQNIEKISDRNLMKLFNLLRKTYRKRDVKTNVDYHHISNTNPLNVKIVKKKKSLKHDEKIIDVIASYLIS